MKAHHHQVRVYYEDTDMAGIVYYANYLKFIERGRSEWVRSIGIDQARLKKEGMFFAVRKVDADFLRPAVYDDVLTVETVVESQTGARLNLIQRVLREGDEIFTAKVMIVSLSVDGYPVALPADIRQLLTEN